MSDWIQTYTGKKFYPLNPLPEDVDVRDIAHALSLTCRFGGHCRELYNVAHHSLMVVAAVTAKDPYKDADDAPPEHKASQRKLLLWALLHDAAEAYLCDLPSPVKRDERMREYREREKAIMEAVCHKFGLPFDEPEEVRRADQAVFEVEAWSLFPIEWVKQWKYVGPDRGERITPMSPARAETAFLTVFDMLYQP